MSQRKRYKKRADTWVTAVRLDLETDGFTYQKWGALQTCKSGDWLVNNQGDTYTVDADSFAETYREAGQGVYVKLTEIWAEVAQSAGTIKTKEGETHYQAGDYLVYNDAAGKDGYAVEKCVFDSQYEPC
ncbi:MAG: hypothetical protein PVF13_00415 [Chromatiales bacterium]|jgi:hypothetical protein